MAADDPSSGLRSVAARALIAVTSATALVVGGGVHLAVDRLHATADNAVEHPGPATTEAQAQAEVVAHARDIIAATGLRQPTAGYLLMSCKNRSDPPYQGAVYLDFKLPPDTTTDSYFRGVAADLVARGWHEGPPPNQHLLGRNLSKDGVNAVLYPNGDARGRGIARIYGQCHDISDRRDMKAEWTDVTDRLG